MKKTCYKLFACLLTLALLLTSFTAMAATNGVGVISESITVSNMGHNGTGFRLVVPRTSLEAAGLTPFEANTFRGWTVSFHYAYTGTKEGALASVDFVNAVISTSELRADGGATLCIQDANLSAATSGLVTAENFSTVMADSDVEWGKATATNVVLTNVDPSISLSLPENTIVLSTAGDFTNYYTDDVRGGWRQMDYSPVGKILYSNTAVLNSDAIAWTTAPATGEYMVAVLKGDNGDSNTGRSVGVSVNDSTFIAGKTHYDDAETPAFPNASGIEFHWVKVGTVNLTAEQKVQVLLKGTSGYARAAAVMLTPVAATYTFPDATEAVLKQASIQTNAYPSGVSKSVSMTVMDASRTKTVNNESIDVLAGLAKAYHYTTAVTTEPTVLDALIALHVQQIGDDFIRHPTDYLTYANGRITKAFGSNGMYYKLDGGALQYGDAATQSIASVSAIRFEAATKYNFEPFTITSISGLGSTTVGGVSHIRFVLPEAVVAKFPFDATAAGALNEVHISGTIAAKPERASDLGNSAGATYDHVWDLDGLGYTVGNSALRADGKTVNMEVVFDKAHCFIMDTKNASSAAVGADYWIVGGNASLYNYNFTVSPADAPLQLAEDEKFYFLKPMDFISDIGSSGVVNEGPGNTALYSTTGDGFQTTFIFSHAAKGNVSDPTVLVNPGAGTAQDNVYPYESSVLVNIPEEDTYYLWVLAHNRSSTTNNYRSYASINGERLSNPLGDCSNGSFNGFKWELAGSATLKAGENRIGFGKLDGYGRIAGALLTTYDIVTNEPTSVTTTAQGTFINHDDTGYIGDSQAEFIRQLEAYPANLIVRPDMYTPVIYDGDVYVRLKNRTTTDAATKCIIAFYDANDNMVDVTVCTQTMPALTYTAGGTGVNYASAQANVVFATAIVPAAWSYGKVMLWDSTNGLMPYSAANTFYNN